MGEYDMMIVGAGIFGLTVAERAVNELGKKVLVIDRRSHIGGNCYSEFDKETGIECHKYGAHLFHTSDEAVWEYVNRFTGFTDYIHKVYTTHNGEVYPMPINLGTINQFFRKNYTPDEAKDVIAKQASDAPNEPKNLAEQGVSLIGKPLFEAFVKNYTAKQWQVPAEELDASIITRLPVRYNYNNNYFSDKHEGLPIDGYEELFRKMTSSENIELLLDTDYFDIEEKLLQENPNAIIIYTGPIDRFYDYRFGELSWRSLDFVKETIDVSDFQGCPVMNYADLEPKYTRIHEFKHFHPERINNPKYPGYADDSKKTIIVREYSKTWKQGDEPYYPVNTADDKVKLAKYKELAEKEKNVLFGGRLGEYAYYDMDKTFASALSMFEEIKEKLLQN